MLTQPRCPECGLQFAWAEVVGCARLQRTTPLFEYRWRERPLRSLLETLLRALYPPAVWRCVPLTVEPRVGPLLIMLVIAGTATAAFDVPFTYAWFYYFNRLLVVSPVPGLVARLGAVTAAAALTWLWLMGLWRVHNCAGPKAKHALRIVVFAWVALLIWSWLLTTLIISACVGFHYVTKGQHLFLTCWSAVEWGVRAAELTPLAFLAWSVCLGLSRYCGALRGIFLGMLSLGLMGATMSVLVLVVAVGLYETLDNPCTHVFVENWPDTSKLIGRLGYWLLHW